MTALTDRSQPFEIVVVGLNHRTTPVALRERFHLDSAKAIAFAHHLREHRVLDEALVLSTCNRLEIYGVTAQPEEAQRAIHQRLAEMHQITLSELTQYTYQYSGLSAVHHGLRVVGSLDSLILGEPQIIGQAKEAYRAALEAETLGFYLNKFFTHAFFTAKRVRSETHVGEGAVSVGYAACELGRQIFGSLAGKHVLVIGAGEIGELIVTHLATQSLGEIYIANRNPERACALQSRFGGTVIPWNKIGDHLDRVDIVMSSVAVTQPILAKRDIEPLLHSRGTPLFLIDVAVPRSLDPELHDLTSVYLYNIDDLEKATAKNHQGRIDEAKKGECIVEEEAKSLHRNLFSNEIAPTISSLSQKLHDIKERELERTFGKFKELPSDMKDAMSRCADAIVNKILHEPILQLKTQQSEGSKIKHLIETISSLFNLD